MKRKIKLEAGLMTALGLFGLLVMTAIHGDAQTPDPQNPNQAQQGQMQAAPQQGPDLAQLNLTQDQIQKIRAINAELKDQRQAANQRLKLAQRTLAEAMESPNQNEALIEQRSRELADAQAATIRLRALSEFRILQVLTPEQRVKLREMRMRNQAIRREQRLENNQRPRALRREALQRGKPGGKLGPAPNKSSPQKPRR